MPRSCHASKVLCLAVVMPHCHPMCFEVAMPRFSEQWGFHAMSFEVVLPRFNIHGVLNWPYLVGFELVMPNVDVKRRAVVMLRFNPRQPRLLKPPPPTAAISFQAVGSGLNPRLGRGSSSAREEVLLQRAKKQFLPKWSTLGCRRGLRLPTPRFKTPTAGRRQPRLNMSSKASLHPLVKDTMASKGCMARHRLATVAASIALP